MLKNQKGFILIVSYLVIVVLITLGAAFISRSISENRIAEKEKNSMQIFYLAEAGLEASHEGLRQNWDGYTTGLPRNNVFSQSFENGSFSVDLENGPLSGTIKVISKVIVGGKIEKTLEEIIRGTTGSGLPGFDFAALAFGNLSLEGNGSINNQDVYVNGNLEVHSTDAIDGGDVYAKGNITLLDGASTTGNVNANGNITVNSSCAITGNATSKETVTNDGTITGTITSNAVPDPVDEADLQAKADSYRLSSEDWSNYEAQARAEGNYHEGDFYPSGNYTGTHYVDGSLAIESDISGTATFVVSGNIMMSSGDVTLDPASGSDYSFITKGNVESTETALGTLGGVTYAEGNFDVSTNISIEGAIICFGNLHGSGDFNIDFPMSAEITLEILSWKEL